MIFNNNSTRGHTGSLLVFHYSGKVGDWTNYFDVKMCEEMDKACADKPKALGLEFVYKLWKVLPLRSEANSFNIARP